MSRQTAVQEADLSFSNKFVLLSALWYIVCVQISLLNFKKIYSSVLKTSNPRWEASTAFYWLTIADHGYL